MLHRIAVQFNSPFYPVLDLDFDLVGSEQDETPKEDRSGYLARIIFIECAYGNSYMSS